MMWTRRIRVRNSQCDKNGVIITKTWTFWIKIVIQNDITSKGNNVHSLSSMYRLSVYLVLLILEEIEYCKRLSDSIKNSDSPFCAYSLHDSIPMSLPYIPGTGGSRSSKKDAQTEKDKIFTHPFHRMFTCRIAK